MFEDGTTASAWARMFSPVSSCFAGNQWLGKSTRPRQRMRLVRQAVGRGRHDGAGNTLGGYWAVWRQHVAFHEIQSNCWSESPKQETCHGIDLVLRNQRGRMPDSFKLK